MLLEIVRYLIVDKNCNINENSKNGKYGTCLDIACIQDHLNVVKYFIIDLCVDPPPLSEEFGKKVKDFLRNHTTSDLSTLRFKKSLQMNQFLSQHGIRAEWSALQQTTFCQNIPLSVFHQYQLVERKPESVADLKIYIPSEDSASDESTFVYVERLRLAKASAFMHNVLVGFMNDIQDASEEEKMQTFHLNHHLLQGTPSDMLKRLIIFLSLTNDSNTLIHSVNKNREDDTLDFDEIVKALKYCRACNALMIDCHLNCWIDHINEYVERFNKEWIDFASRKNRKETKSCISNIRRFDSDMLLLWTQVLGHTDSLYFFMLVNAATATAESPATIASKCHAWLMSSDASGKYEEALKYRFVVAIVNEDTGYNMRNGKISAPIAVAEEFVKRKRLRTE